MVEQYLSKENKLNTKSIENLYFISTTIFLLSFWKKIRENAIASTAFYCNNNLQR